MSAYAPVLYEDARVVRRTARADEIADRAPWIDIPPGGVPFFSHGSIPSPAYGTQTLICSYTVQDGFEGVLTDVMNYFTDAGASFVQGSGDVIWVVDIDRPIAGALVTGRFLPDYNSITTQLGDLSQPWPVRGGWRMRQGEVYRYKVTTVATVGVGAPNFVHAAMLGWVWPSTRKR